MPPHTKQPPPPAPTPAVAGRRLDLDVVRGIAILLALGWHFSRTASGNPVIDVLQWPGATFGVSCSRCCSRSSSGAGPPGC